MNRHSIAASAAVILTTTLLAGCATTVADLQSSADSSSADTQSGVTLTQSTSTTSIEADVADTETNSNAGGVNWSALPTTEVTLSAEGLAISEGGTYILTGSTGGQVIVNSEDSVRLILDNASIESGGGAAIQVDNAELVVVEAAEGTTNTISDASTRTDEEIDGAIYSADDLLITGTGTLEVIANFADGVVGKDDLTIDSATVNVVSADDGIRGTDSLTVNGGTITVTAGGDGLKSTNAVDLGLGALTVTGGAITISSGDDALKAEQSIWITGGTIDITESVEGIEAPVVTIDGGQISVVASDDGINASASDLITSGLAININGGDLTIVMGQGDTDALDSNGDLNITGGNLNITAQSPFDYDGSGTFTGGTVIVNGEQVNELTQQMMGPGGGAMMGPGANG